MKTYSRIAVLVKAKQWHQHGDHPEVKEIPRGHEEAVTLAAQLGAHLNEWGFIETLEGGHLVKPGAWIIQGVAGEFYPCQDGIFQQLYEEVPE